MPIVLVLDAALVPVAGELVADVDPSDSELLSAPPLLLIVTPDPTCVVDEVAPELFVASVDRVVPVDVGLVLDAVPCVPVLATVGVCVPLVVLVCDPEVAAPLLLEVDESLDDDDDEPVESAFATPGEVATITPIPNAAARAPTRPT